MGKLNFVKCNNECKCQLHCEYPSLSKLIKLQNEQDQHSFESTRREWNGGFIGYKTNKK